MCKISLLLLKCARGKKSLGTNAWHHYCNKQNRKKKKKIVNAILKIIQIPTDLYPYSFDAKPICVCFFFSEVHNHNFIYGKTSSSKIQIWWGHKIIIWSEVINPSLFIKWRINASSALDRQRIILESL